MKKVLYLLFAVLIVISGCKKLDKFTKFNMDYDESIVISSNTIINLPIDILTPDIETNSESEFEINDTRKDLVEEVLLKKMTLAITSPENSDFSFLESIEIFLSAEGLDEIKVAWNNMVSSTAGNMLELETTTDDLQEYIKKDKFSLRVKTVTDEAITSDYHIDIHTEFFVDAKVAGV